MKQTAISKAVTGNTAPTLVSVHSVIPELDGVELASLKADIQKNGLLVPILVKGDVIVDGRARKQICDELGLVVQTIDIGKANAVATAVSANVHRRHLTKSQLAMIAEKMAVRPKGSNQHAVVQACSRKEVAELFGISEDSIDRARNIRNKGCPELADSVTNGQTTLNEAIKVISEMPNHDDQRAYLNGEKSLPQVAKLIRNLPNLADQEKAVDFGIERVNRETLKKAKIAEMREKGKELTKLNGVAIETLKGTFQVVYADPPWDYGGTNNMSCGAPTDHYPVQSLEEIKSLPVRKHLDEHAAGFVWVPNCLIPQGLEVLKEWGFEYVTLITWCKPKSVPSTAVVRASSETLLVGKKGMAFHEMSERRDTWFEEPATEHSRKPESVADMISALYPDGFAKIELYGRKLREGWTVHGNEAVSQNNIAEASEATLTDQPVPTSTVSSPMNHMMVDTAKAFNELYSANDQHSQLVA